MNLKPGAAGSDRRVMFFSAVPAPDLVPSALKSLRLSLNTPVVAIDDLPVGAARAAIALHQGAGIGLQLTVAVRLVRTGQVLFFASDEEPSESYDSALDLDVALSFAEAMGFLFDEDEVEARGDAGAREAARLWYDLIGGPPAEEGGCEDAAPGHGTESRPLTKFRPWAAGACSDAPRERSDAPASAGCWAGGPEGEHSREDRCMSLRAGPIPDRETEEDREAEKAWRGAW
jgi:hypothetical protein